MTRAARALAAVALASLAGCAPARLPGGGLAGPPFTVALDAATGQGVSPRRVVSVGRREAVVEGAIGRVCLRPTGAALPARYALVLVTGGPTAGPATLEGLTVEADAWRLETAYRRGERTSEGAWAEAGVAGATVTIAPDGPGRMRVTLPGPVLARLAAATRVACVAWVDAYRR